MDYRIILVTWLTVNYPASRTATLRSISEEKASAFRPHRGYLAPDRGEEPGSDTASEAITRLSEVFEIDRPAGHVHHRTPPEYMTDLYNTIAEPRSGITKTSGPFDADVIRGFPDRDSSQQMHFQFNVSFIKEYERILETEFHLYKLRPRLTGSTWRDMIQDPRPMHIIELRLYQVLDRDQANTEEGRRLIEHRRIGTHAHGWQTFKVGTTVQNWLNKTEPNYGFLVTAHTLNGRPVNGSVLRFAQRGQHHDRLQPVLVVFSADKRPKHRNYISAEDLEFERQVQMLNEANWSDDGDDAATDELGTESRRYRRSTDEQQMRRNRKNVCSKHSMYVDFEKIGWSDWIISPKGYNAYQCRGDCPFPLGQNQKPTNHATVQSIVHALRIVDGVHTPCCVPNKLYSISLLYFDDHENVILKQYDDMVAASCGCH